MYQKGVGHRYYRLMDKYERYDDDEAPEIQKIRKRVAVQTIKQALHGKESISVISFFTEFEQACHSSRIEKAAAV